MVFGLLFGSGQQQPVLAPSQHGYVPHGERVEWEEPRQEQSRYVETTIDEKSTFEVAGGKNVDSREELPTYGQAVRGH